jgi:hypothetical protein
MTSIFGSVSDLPRLRLRFRVIEKEIGEETEKPFYNQIAVQKLKRERGRLKMLITRLESNFSPDILA